MLGVALTLICMSVAPEIEMLVAVSIGVHPVEWSPCHSIVKPLWVSNGVGAQLHIP